MVEPLRIRIRNSDAWMRIRNCETMAIPAIVTGGEWITQDISAFSIQMNDTLANEDMLKKFNLRSIRTSCSTQTHNLLTNMWTIRQPVATAHQVHVLHNREIVVLMTGLNLETRYSCCNIPWKLNLSQEQLNYQQLIRSFASLSWGLSFFMAMSPTKSRHNYFSLDSSLDAFPNSLTLKLSHTI